MRPQSKHYFNYRLKYGASDDANTTLHQSLKTSTVKILHSSTLK